MGRPKRTAGAGVGSKPVSPQKQAQEQGPAAPVSEKQLTLTQCRAMVRIQLEIDDLPTNVSNDWIDGLFKEFDADGSGTIDDAEWDKLVAVLRTRANEIAAAPAAPAAS
eukprot:COSAG06_NODE_30245_length_542_cov_0.914221_1_plen_108_part_01